MFTGLIQDVGRIESVRRKGDEAGIRVSCNLAPYTHGESIAVSGACLSVTAFDDRGFEVFASAETVARTALGDLSPGAPVNLERAMTLADPLGGHLVTGHVDTRVKLVRRDRQSAAQRFVFAMPKDVTLHPQIVAKGSVALDGVSLTVNHVGEAEFDVMIIPVTLSHTTLDALSPGDGVNLETDLIAKYVGRYAGFQQAGDGETLTMDLLAKSGFVR